MFIRCIFILTFAYTNDVKAKGTRFVFGVVSSGNLSFNYESSNKGVTSFLCAENAEYLTKKRGHQRGRGHFSLLFPYLTLSFLTSKTTTHYKN